MQFQSPPLDRIGAWWRGPLFGLLLLAAQAMPQALAASVATHTVRAEAGAVATHWEAVVQAVRQATVSAQTGGRVQSLHAKVGERVRAGQLLAVVDDREAQTGVQRSQAQLAQAQAQWTEAQAQVQRVRSLQGQGFVSKSALDSAEMQLQSAQAAREQAQAGVRQASLQQGYTRLVAPYDGWVLQTHAQAGDLAVVGSPVVTVYAPQPLRVVVQLPASQRVLAQQAQRVEVLVGDGAGGVRSLRPSSTQVVPAADPVAQTQEWRLELAPQDSEHLVPGQQVQVRLTGQAASAAKTLQVPTQALVRRGELTGVYVAQGDRFVLRAVRTAAPKGGATVEVLSGLREGDVIALEPLKAAAQR